MFKLVIANGSGFEDLVNPLSGELVMLPDGKMASDAAREWSATTGKRVQVRPISNPQWREQEQAKFENGSLRSVPWGTEDFWTSNADRHRDHFAAFGYEMRLSYFESEAKGEAGIRTTIRPGRYLTQYFSDVLSGREINLLAKRFEFAALGHELNIAETADEFERIYSEFPFWYEYGHRNCMAYKASHYESPFHPVRVYADPGDIKLAYVMHDGDVLSRALIYPRGKTYARTYEKNHGSGDAMRLEGMLNAMGYSKGSLDGARIARHVVGNQFVCPYIDVSYRVSDTGTYLVIDEDGDINAEQTDGLTDTVEELGPETQYCPRCEDHEPEDEFRTVYVLVGGSRRERDWCGYCSRNHASICDETGERWSDDDMVTLEDGSEVSPVWFERNGTECEESGENIRICDAVTLNEDGETVSPVWFDRHGFRCEDCHRRFRRETHGVTSGVAVCLTCGEERQEEAGRDQTLNEEIRAMARRLPVWPSVDQGTLFANNGTPMPSIRGELSPAFMREQTSPCPNSPLGTICDNGCNHRGACESAAQAYRERLTQEARERAQRDQETEMRVYASPEAYVSDVSIQFDYELLTKMTDAFAQGPNVFPSLRWHVRPVR